MELNIKSRTSLSLQEVSSVLKIPLTIEDGKILGSGLFELKLKDMKVKFDVEAKALFNSEQLGVLFHISGDLYLLVAHYYHTKISSAFLLDSSKAIVKLEKLIKPNATLKETVDAIKHTVVASFYNKNYEWHKLTLPK